MMRPSAFTCATALLALAVAGAARAQDDTAPRQPVQVAPNPALRAPSVALPKGTPADIVAADPMAPITTFADAVERAYWTHPSLLAERSRMEATDYRLPQARAQYAPKLTYSGSYGYQRDNFEQAAGGYRTLSGWSSVATAVLTQPLYTFGRNAAGERGALAQVTFERAILRHTEQQTLLDTISAYIAVRRDRAGVGIARDNLALLEKELADTDTRFKAREVTATDLEQVRTRVEQGRAQLLTAERQAASSDANFLSQVGGPAGDLAQPAALVLPIRSLEEAYAYAELHSPVLSAAYAREKVSRSQRDAARADLYPRVDLRGRADYGTVTPYTDSLRQTELRGEVVLSGSLFEGGLKRARLAEAQATNDSDWRLIDGTVRENRAETADAWNEWLTQSASIDRLKVSVDAAQRAYDGALQQEKAGIRTTLDVLDLARELLIARSGYNSATASAYIAQARLLAAVGSLEQAWLFPDAPRHDPEAHFRKVRGKGDVPLLTPAMSALDGVASGSNADRQQRDPAAQVGVGGVDVPAPASQPR